MVRRDGVGVYRDITITGNKINDTGAGGIKLAAPDTTKIRNTDVHIAHNSIREVGGDGIVVHNSDTPLIEHNDARDLGQGKYPFLGGNFAGMWPYNSKNPTFQYNYSFGNAGGFYLNCISACGTESTEADVVVAPGNAPETCPTTG
jgi:hypothetical protein